jgi:putative membrane protein
VFEVYRQNNIPSRRWFLVPLLVISGLIAIFVGASLYFYRAPPATVTYPWFGFWWFPFGWFIFIPVIFIAFFAFRWFLWGGWGWGRSYGNNYDPALETLRERFARGEISREQFDQMVKDLQR